MITELDVIRGIADGRLPSPQVYYGACYMALRISSTGAAWRSATKEYVWRNPGLWIAPEMAARWLGAPVILQHPASGSLNSESYVRSVIGAVAHAYPRDIDGVPELWCIGRLGDLEVADAITKNGADTSPSVRFARDAVNPITLVSGDRWLVERNPVFIDHLAIVERGVWSRGGAPSGVALEEATT